MKIVWHSNINESPLAQNLDLSSFKALDQLQISVQESFNFFSHFIERLPEHKKAWVGIGGSSLGARLIAHFLRIKGWTFFENLDPMVWENDGPMDGALFVSKSGSTFETLRWLDFFIEKVARLSERSLVVTQNAQSQLLEWATKHNVPVLFWPQDLPGRYSIIGPWLYGVVPTEITPDVIFSGLRRFWDSYQDQLEQMAKLLFAWQSKVSGIYVMVYGDRWQYFGPWLEQLWNESLGKVGSSWPFLKGGLGSVDQHSNLQFLMDSPKPWGTIILDGTGHNTPEISVQRYLKGLTITERLKAYLSLQARATARALEKANKPVAYIQLPDGDVSSLLGVCYFWMNLVSFLGYKSQIDPFDQPAVEVGKVLLKQSLLS